MNDLTIRVDALRHTYESGVEAVAGVDLTIAPGERVAIVGQNGAGKTTLVRHLNGMVRPTEGSVHIGDWITSDKSIAELSHRVGYVFQNPDEQIFARTVEGDVSFGPKNLGFEPEEVTQSVMSALEAVGLAHEAHVHPHHLSLSERKRVAIAAVLAMRTPIVVLDEPTTGQDEGGVRLIAGIIDDLTARGTTVVAITHDMDFCVENFERVVVMARGTVRADGPAAQVFADQPALEAAAVEPPQLARLARTLGWSETTVDPSSFVDAYERRRRG
ncbi:energy-coupling factor ABC transporter ATP-binding protein [Microcella sp.]|uniref:energy-coupling factor ABC transporter ATP-binding protein n=1 Tax=Microcella sp. TaxID=1913979 RepID=UPI00255EF38F|nr:ABC transporter ATP-binding protein [Microcella sp.]MBX9472689.1 energy-coupling factor ABC transporter ATP-binding protein [Microcella sp.]